MKETLLQAPDSQLDSSIKPLIEKWSNPPAALQVLEVLDHCIHSALASGLVVSLLQNFYAERCNAEGTTHQALEPLAVWRHK
jgi:hypothetical protein